MTSRPFSQHFGQLSIACCGSSLVLPFLVYWVGRGMDRWTPYELEQLSGWVFMGLLMLALISGILGWQQRLAKIGFGFACGLFLAIVIFSVIPFSATPPDLPLRPSPQVPGQ